MRTFCTPLSPVFTSWHDELSGGFYDPGAPWHLKVGPDLLDDPVLYVDVGPDSAQVWSLTQIYSVDFS